MEMAAIGSSNSSENSYFPMVERVMISFLPDLSLFKSSNFCSFSFVKRSGNELARALTYYFSFVENVELPIDLAFVI